MQLHLAVKDDGSPMQHQQLHQGLMMKSILDSFWIVFITHLLPVNSHYDRKTIPFRTTHY